MKKKIKPKKSVKPKKKTAVAAVNKKERMEPLGIRTSAMLRAAIENDAKARKPRLTPSDVVREVLEGHYKRKQKRGK